MDATRLEAMSALCCEGSYDALPVMLDLLGDRNSMVVKEAVVGLRRIALPGAKDALLKMWKKRPQSFIGQELPGALAKCAPKDPDVQKAVYASLKSRDTIVQLRGIIALSDLPMDDALQKTLLKKLRDRSNNTRGLAAWSLGMHGCVESVDDLEKALKKETSVEVRTCIEAALAHIANPDEAALSGMTWRFLP